MRKHTQSSLCLLAMLALLSQHVQSAELTGRFSMLGVTADAAQGDVGYVDADHHTPVADQQSLRLMLEHAGDSLDWDVHLKLSRRHVDGFADNAAATSALFRYRDAANDWIDEVDTDSTTRAGYELDRAALQWRFEHIRLGIGRQPIDWGAGRFWQPLNVFGAFAPTDLDTDFKPGIDAAVLDWYRSAFSSLTAVYVPAPARNSNYRDNGAMLYRSRVGERSEASLMAARVIDNDIVGAVFESEWQGMGWRLEGAHYRREQQDDSFNFWIAGIDYQYNNGLLLALEWYRNGNGAEHRAALAALQADPLVAAGLQQQLGRQLLGLALEKDLTPLLHAGYTLLLSPLKDNDNQTATSLLHQFNLVYSVSNESDLLLSLLLANGRGLDSAAAPQSEFGHLPSSLSLRLRFYF